MHISLRIEIEKKILSHFYYSKKKLWHKFKKAEKKIDIKSREKVLFSIFIYSISNSYLYLSLSIYLFHSFFSTKFWLLQLENIIIFFISPLSISSTCCCRLIKYSNDSHFFLRNNNNFSFEYD